MAPDAAPDLFATGGLLYADDRFDEARATWEEGFAAARIAGEDHLAVRIALQLVDLHTSVLGNRAAGNGWRSRARRILDTLGPCVEAGYYELAEIACNRLDVDELLRSADRALAIAAEYGDHRLEVRALADSGLALVSLGRADEGFGRIDEALAAICAGEVDDPFVVATSFCALLTSCERAGDLDRAAEWIRLVGELVLDPMDGRPRVLNTHCRAAYGAVLSDAGRWAEAEAALLDVFGPHESSSVGHRIDTAARLAELRIAQGRLDDAAALLAPYEDRPPTWTALAALHLRRGACGLAAATARRALAVIRGDVTRRRPLLAILVESSIACDDLDAARAAAVELDAIAATGGAVAVADAELARARIAAATGDGDDALAHCARAATSLESGAAPLRLLTVLGLQTELLAATDARDDAVATGRAALALAQRLGAAAEADRVAAILRTLGVTVRRATPAGGDPTAELTRREHEVLELLGSGATNAEIGAQLFISPKTVEHHVSRILAKLGVRTRAEAAAVAAARGRNPGVD